MSEHTDYGIPIVDGRIRRRRSAAYFHDGNIDATISTLSTCLRDGEPSRYAPITVAEHIRAKLAVPNGKADQVVLAGVGGSSFLHPAPPAA